MPASDRAFARHCAAASANGRKTVAMTGDGGFFLDVRRLWTVVQEYLDPGDDRDERIRGDGVMKHIEDALRRRAATLRTW